MLERRALSVVEAAGDGCVGNTEEALGRAVCDDVLLLLVDRLSVDVGAAGESDRFLVDTVDDAGIREKQMALVGRRLRRLRDVIEKRDGLKQRKGGHQESKMRSTVGGMVTLVAKCALLECGRVTNKSHGGGEMEGILGECLRIHPVALLQELHNAVSEGRASVVAGVLESLLGTSDQYVVMGDACQSNSIIFDVLEKSDDAVVRDGVKLLQGIAQRITEHDNDGVLSSLQAVLDRLNNRKNAEANPSHLSYMPFPKESTTAPPVEVDLQESDVEEGELLDEAAPMMENPMKESLELGDHGRASQSLRGIDGLSPDIIGPCIRIRQVPDTLSKEDIEVTCSKYSAVDFVEIYDGEFWVAFTSIPGAIRCFEAIHNKGASVFGEVPAQYGGTPEAKFCSHVPGSHTKAGLSHHIWISGIQTVDQEDEVRRKLNDSKVPPPNAFLSVSCSVPGLILSFDSQTNLDDAFHCLEGRKTVLEGKRSLDELDEPHQKRTKLEPVPFWSGLITRKSQPQCTVVISGYNIRKDQRDEDILMGEPENWPSVLDASQRADVSYVLETLFPSTQPNMKQVVPIELEESELSEGTSGLISLDVYLREKDRAGVISLPAKAGMKHRTLYLIPESNRACDKLGIDPSLFRKRHRMIGLVVGGNI